MLDASTVLAAPLCATLFAEFGADVIKIEQPGRGDATRTYHPMYEGRSLHYKITNRNKSGITLDFRKPEAAPLFYKLVRTADIVVMNFRPAALRKWHIDYDDLIAHRPGLIYFHLSAFGRTGPYADRPGFARVAEGLAGLAYVTGFPDRPPIFAGYPIVDGIAGYYGAFAIMLALRERERSGAGQLIDLALYEPLLRMMEDFAIGYGATGLVKERAGTANPNISPNDVYPTSDGSFVILPISTEAMWQRLVRAIDAPELAPYDTNAVRLTKRPEIDARISAFTQAHPLAEVLAAFERAGIAAGRIYAVNEIFADPQIAARENLARVPDPDLGIDLVMQRPIPRFSSIEHVPLVPGPLLGADNERIYGELGVDAAQLAAYRAAGVI